MISFSFTYIPLNWSTVSPIYVNETRGLISSPEGLESPFEVEHIKFKLLPVAV